MNNPHTNSSYQAIIMHQPVNLHADGYHFTDKYDNQIIAYRHVDDDTQLAYNMTHEKKLYSHRILVNDILNSKYDSLLTNLTTKALIK